MRPEYCWECSHALDIHIPERFTRRAYCAMWGCNCFCYLTVSRQSILPEKGVDVGPSLPGTNVGVPRSGSLLPGLRDSGEPPPKQMGEMR